MPRTMLEFQDKKHPLDKQPDIRTTPKGTDFLVTQDPSGLYCIKMVKPGGKVPSICEEKFTGNAHALKALEQYIKTKE